MKRIRWIPWVTTFVGGGLVGSLLLVALLAVLQIGMEIAPGLTKEGLLRVRPGMTEEEVLDAIGRPLWEHRYYGPGAGTQWVDQPGRSIWQYARPGLFDSGFAAYVLFEGSRATGTDLKYSDFTIYAHTRWKCPQWLGNRQAIDYLSDGANR